MGAEQTPNAQVRRDLGRIARRMRLARLSAGVCTWLATIGVMLLALFLVDNFLHLPAALRLLATLGALTLAGWELWVQVLRPARERFTPERAAREIEAEGGRAD